MPRDKIVEAEVLVLVDDYSGFTKLLGEHGFSVLINLSYETRRKYSVLLDVGNTGRVLIENASSLNVELSRVDTLVLSHRHHDHSGGIPVAARLLGGKPLIAHPAVLKPCYADTEGFKRFNVGFSPETRRSLQEFELVFAKSSLELAPDLWFLGEIERHYDNEYAVRWFKTFENGELVDDPMPDDTAVAFRAGDRAYVIAGCSHSGIQNIARQARKITNARELVVIGGFHLVGIDDDTIRRVIEELENEGVIEVHTGHCTGLRAEAELLRKYGEKMYKIHSGYRLYIKNTQNSGKEQRRIH